MNFKAKNTYFRIRKEGQDTLAFLIKYAPAGILAVSDRTLFDNLPDAAKKL